MEKRYQVFVSSTYADLLDERAEVMQALLELDCMPAGMELFPAANDDQWNWIKKVIDESDYYIVIVGGRYGTISDTTKISYTEMEYRYALEIEKPVIGFLHENIELIPSGKTESNPPQKEKLNSFRKLVGKKLCKYWSNPSDLGAKVSRSITQLIKQYPAVGWIRANTIPEDSTKEILTLKKEIESLQEKLQRAGVEEPAGIESLCKGKDQFSIEFSYETKLRKEGGSGNIYYVKGDKFHSRLNVTWDDLFKALAPELIVQTSEYDVMREISKFIESNAIKNLEKKHKNDKIEQIRICAECLKTIKIQLRALKLITILDENESWALTPYGDNYMTRLIAIKKS